jgi:hypothetical protein
MIGPMTKLGKTSFLIFIFGIILLSLTLIYVWDPYSLTEKHPAITIFVVLSIFFVCGIALQYKFAPEPRVSGSFFDLSFFDFIKDLGKLFCIMAVIWLCIISIAWLFRNYSSATFVFTWFINILIIAGAIGGVLLLFKKDKEINELNKINTSKNQQHSFISLIKNIFFYLPCLFIDFAKYIKEQYNITTRPVWIVLLLEIVLVGSTFVLPYLFHQLTISNGSQILRDPIYLNKKQTLGTFENLTSKADGKYVYNYHYAISAWIYLNSQPPNTSEAYSRYAILLDYAGKPVIEYNGSLNTIRIRTETKNREYIIVYSTKDIAYQKWMNIVINYDGGNMDVFLNGKLVGTQPNIAPYMSYDSVNSGENKGIHGGICNVMYYNKTLSRSDITMTYNLLKHLDTPVT